MSIRRLVSVNLYYKDPIKHVGLIQSKRYHRPIKFSLFSPWFSLTIAHFGIKQQSLTLLVQIENKRLD